MRPSPDRDHRRCRRDRRRDRRCHLREAPKRNEAGATTRGSTRHTEPREVSELEADKQAAEAQDRAAHAKREQFAAQQQQIAAAEHRSTASRNLNPRADEVDPDVEAADTPDRGPVEGRTS